MYCLKLNCVKFNFKFYSNLIIDVSYNRVGVLLY